MNHKNGFNPLSRTTAHRRAMSRNMVTSLFRYERITTTKAKALEVRKAAEKLITRSKVDTVHNRRQAARYIQDATILAKLFTDIGPRMKDRAGGYTRGEVPQHRLQDRPAGAGAAEEEPDPQLSAHR